MSAEAVARLCDAISGGSLDDAARLARAELPFEPFEQTKRSRSDFEKVSVFLRDGFIDRYSGDRLVFPGTLRLLSYLLRDEIPYHPNWPPAECHRLYWDLSPTVDHVNPVARGGPDSIDNLVCTSMLSNASKSHWVLEELGWRLEPKGKLHDWDGLLAWFMDYTLAEPSVLDLRAIDKRSLRDQRALKNWRRAAERALDAYGAERLPTSLRSFAKA